MKFEANYQGLKTTLTELTHKRIHISAVHNVLYRHWVERDANACKSCYMLQYTDVKSMPKEIYKKPFGCRLAIACNSSSADTPGLPANVKEQTKRFNTSQSKLFSSNFSDLSNPGSGSSCRWITTANKYSNSTSISKKYRTLSYWSSYVFEHISDKRIKIEPFCMSLYRVDDLSNENECC